MKELAEFLVKNIASSPKKVTVEENTEGLQTTVLLSVAGDDMGKIIGKGGRVIKAIRSLLRIKATKENKRVYLQLVEPDQIGVEEQTS